MSFLRSLSLRSLAAAKTLIHDETGGETVEWVLTFGLVVLICIVVLLALGKKVSDRWNDIDANG